MSKKSPGMLKEIKLLKKIKLPACYPRTEKIIIFDDMSVLDEKLFYELENFKETMLLLLRDPTSGELERFCSSCSLINATIYLLRDACSEFERFWQGEEWEPENDETFMERMNNPNELQWLINYLDHGRIKLVDGKNLRFYEPAYEAAARSLQTAMYLKEIRPDDKELIDEYIQGLQNNLTRYHAAALEIAAHRNNTYMHNTCAHLEQNEGNIQTGNKIRTCAKLRANEQKLEADQEHTRLVQLVREKMMEGKGKTNAVNIIAKSEKVSERTIYRAFERIEKAEKLLTSELTVSRSK